MRFKYLIINLLLSFFLITIPSCQEGEFAIIEGTVLDENGMPAEGSQLVLMKPNVAFLSPEFAFDTINIKEDGSFSYAFFIEEQANYFLAKPEDKDFKCASSQNVKIDRRNVLNYVAKRKQELVKYLIRHDADSRPDNFVFEYNYMGTSCGSEKNINYFILGQAMSDTLTEYLLKVPENDTIQLQIRAQHGNTFIGNDNFGLNIGTDTILIESDF